MGSALHTNGDGDRELIRRFLAGDEGAFRMLHARHSPRLRMLVRRILGGTDEVDDVVQDTWLAGCRAMSRFNGTAQFSTWLATIGIRSAYARATRTRGAEAELTDAVEALPTGDSATAMDLEMAIERLAATERAVVVLHDVEGYTHDEIARQLDIAPGTSRNMLSRARATLRGLLNEGASND